MAVFDCCFSFSIEVRIPVARSPMLAAASLIPSKLTPVRCMYDCSRNCCTENVFPLIFGYHSQAGGAAVHAVQLFVEWKFAHNCLFCFTLFISQSAISFILSLSLSKKRTGVFAVL